MLPQGPSVGDQVAEIPTRLSISERAHTPGMAQWVKYKHEDLNPTPSTYVRKKKEGKKERKGWHYHR